MTVCAPSFASHILGGEMTYKYMGNNTYRIYLSIYEDCINGDPDAIDEDNPAYIRIFKGTLSSGNNTLFSPSVTDSVNGDVVDSIYCNLNNPDSNFIVPVNIPVANQTIINPPQTCVRKKIFVKDYVLPPDPQGYIVIYQRCCRSSAVTNVNNPTSIGTTYYCSIPPSGIAANNNSAVFKHNPPQIICLNEPFIYDHSATDNDGDSLSYTFYTAYTGGDQSNSKPFPSCPPYQPVSYSTPFSFSNPMSGIPQIQIDPLTGIITGTPNLLGRYVVTIHCNEWRNGVLINTIMREFLFIVTNCSYHDNNNTNPAKVIDGVYIPNAFSPNNDGRNDIFAPVLQSTGVYTVKYIKISDRYGKVLYNDTKGWDGTYNGVKQEIGVYMYEIQFRDNSGKTVTSDGTVTLIR